MEVALVPTLSEKGLACRLHNQVSPLAVCAELLDVNPHSALPHLSSAWP